MEEYEYKIQTFELKTSIKLQTWWHAVISRKYMLKHFCCEIGIDYPPSSQKHYNLPRDFLINESPIRRLGIIRDNLIFSQFNKYKSKQNKTSKKILELRTDIANAKSYLKTEGDLLKSLKEQRSKAKEPLEKISLQHRCATQEAKNKNLNDEISELDDNLTAMLKISSDNKSAWNKQVDSINNTIQEEIEHFIFLITKKIRGTLNYTDFKYSMPEYGEGIKKILTGEKNDA